jgi:hypothetical protein
LQLPSVTQVPPPQSGSLEQMLLQLPSWVQQSGSGGEHESLQMSSAAQAPAQSGSLAGSLHAAVQKPSLAHGQSGSTSAQPKAHWPSLQQLALISPAKAAMSSR